MVKQKIASLIQNMIASGDLEHAANELVHFFDEKTETAGFHLYNQALHQLSQLNELKHSELAGVISKVDADLTRNKIRSGLLIILDEIKHQNGYSKPKVSNLERGLNTAPAPKRKNIYLIFGAVAVLMIGALGLFFMTKDSPTDDPQLIVAPIVIDDVPDAKEEALKKQQGEYDVLISEADTYFELGKFDDALCKYEDAEKISVADNSSAVKGVEKCNEEINARITKERLQVEYDSLIAVAESYYSQGKYADALSIYEKATNIKVADKDNKAEKGVKNCEDKLNAETSTAQLKTEYNELVKEADRLFRKKDYENARAKYNEANGLSLTREYKSKARKGGRKAIGMIGQQKEYNDLIKEADRYYNKKDYKNALEKYKKAYTLTDARDRRANEGIQKCKNKLE